VTRDLTPASRFREGASREDGEDADAKSRPGPRCTASSGGRSKGGQWGPFPSRLFSAGSAGGILIHNDAHLDGMEKGRSRRGLIMAVRQASLFTGVGYFPPCLGDFGRNVSRSTISIRGRGEPGTRIPETKTPVMKKKRARSAGLRLSGAVPFATDAPAEVPCPSSGPRGGHTVVCFGIKSYLFTAYLPYRCKHPSHEVMNGSLGFLLSDTRPQVPMPRVARRYRGFTRRQQVLVPVPPQCFKNRMTTGEYSLTDQRFAHRIVSSMLRRTQHRVG
jgi:hypothetical protein